MFQWITTQITTFGYWGVAFLMLLENIFPPIPSELIMPMAGFVAQQGLLKLPLVIAAGTFGALIGAWFWYEIGRHLGKERLKNWAARHGRWFGVHPHDFDRTEDWFRRNGNSAVFIGRMVPGIRTLISVPAGIVHMPRLRFLGWSALGSLTWCSALAFAGYLLGTQYQLVEKLLNPASTAIMIVLVLIYLYRVITWKPAA